MDQYIKQAYIRFYNFKYELAQRNNCKIILYHFVSSRPPEDSGGQKAQNASTLKSNQLYSVVYLGITGKNRVYKLERIDHIVI